MYCVHTSSIPTPLIHHKTDIPNCARGRGFTLHQLCYMYYRDACIPHAGAFAGTQVLQDHVHLSKDHMYGYSAWHNPCIAVLYYYIIILLYMQSINITTYINRCYRSPNYRSFICSTDHKKSTCNVAFIRYNIHL